MTEETAQDYLIALARLPEGTQYVVFRKCLESWSKVDKMPPIAFLLDLAAKYHCAVEDELAAAARWGDDEAKRILADLKSKAPAPVVENTDIDEVRRDFCEREIRLMRERYPQSEGETRLSRTAPTDPDELRVWAHQKAIEMGWMDHREPGEGDS